MKIITLAHQKGGVGKSTLTLNLAAAFGYSKNVAILDSDSQGSLSNVSGFQKKTTVIPMPPVAKLDTLLEAPYDIVLIDTPPYQSADLPAILKVSDYVLVPCRFGIFDAIAVRSTVQLIQQCVGLQYGVVMNAVRPGSKHLNREVSKLLADNQIHVLASHISERDSYVRSPLVGGIFELDDAKAKQEVLALAYEIITELGL